MKFIDLLYCRFIISKGFKAKLSYTEIMIQRDKPSLQCFLMSDPFQLKHHFYLYVHYILLTMFSLFTNIEFFFRNRCTSILCSLFLLVFSASCCTCRFCSVWCWSLWLCLCLSCFTHLFLSKWRYSLSLEHFLSLSALAW